VVLLSKKSTTSILLAHDSNSSDNSKEVSLSNLLKANSDFYKMHLEGFEKDGTYFDKEINFTLQLVKETNEKMPKNSDNDRYSKYNEYSEYDKRYYYCNRRYERKIFPIMSSIISPVTV
jgi:hypothetical protein